MATVNQYTLFEYLFEYYNHALFQGQLKNCFIGMSRKKGVVGFFSPESWANEQNKGIHKNSHILYTDWKTIEWHMEFVHNLIHVWQHDFGTPSRSGYHNSEYAQKLEEVGLIPSATGEPGGKKTGQTMAQYFAPTGLFIKAYDNLHKNIFEYLPLPVIEEHANGGNSSRTKHQCPSCGNIVYGKRNLAILCLACKKKFEQQKDPFQNTVRSLSDLWILVVKNAQKQCFCAFFS